MAEDLGERTEQPTSLRRSEARRRGQVARSADLSAAVILLVAVVLLMFFAQEALNCMATIVRGALSEEALSDNLTTGSLGPELLALGSESARLMGPAMLAIMVVALISGLSQVGFHISTDPLKPSLNKLNVVKGFGRILGRKAAVKGAIDTLKFVVVGAVAALVVMGQFDRVVALANVPLGMALMVAAELAQELALWLLSVLLVLGLIDLIVQRRQLTSDLKMTKQEVKDERRSTEGDLETKARRLRLGRQIALQRLASSVPKADVVVTNPTHFSVALAYDSASGMRAPRVIAKGADYLALKIRYLAAGAGVPIIERPPLARALYAQVPVGKEIPPEHYEAVAEVLAYVYRLDGRTVAA